MITCSNLEARIISLRHILTAHIIDPYYIKPSLNVFFLFFF